MAKTVRNILLIAGSVFFTIQLISIGLLAGIPVIGVIVLLIVLLSGKKEKIISNIKAFEKWGHEKLEIGVQMAETAAVLGVQVTKGAGKVIEAGYKEMGGTEGAKKAVGKLSKAAGEVMKIGGYGVAKIAEEASNAAEDISKQLEKDRAKKQHKKLLKDASEYVDFDILDDD